MRIAECGIKGARETSQNIAFGYSATQNFQMKNDLEIRTKKFELVVIDLVSKLRKNKVADVIGYQLLRSGTSIGANYREAGRTLSHDDFIHKIGICEKEATETEYWLSCWLKAAPSTQTLTNTFALKWANFLRF